MKLHNPVNSPKAKRRGLLLPHDLLEAIDVISIRVNAKATGRLSARRSGKLFLVRDILGCISKAAPDGASISRIVFEANTTHQRAKAILHILQSKEIAKKIDGQYHLTNKGKMAFNELQRLELLDQALGLI